jgi:hypothetical protein
LSETLIRRQCEKPEGFLIVPRQSAASVPIRQTETELTLRIILIRRQSIEPNGFLFVLD